MKTSKKSGQTETEKKKRAPASKQLDDPSKYPDSGGTMERNVEIAAAIEQLAEAEKNNPETNFWAVRGLMKASDAIRNAPFPIQSGKQAMKCLAGIGEGTAKKVDEIISTGKLAALDTATSDPRVACLMQLQRVHGIGPAKAAELVDAHGITGLDALAKRTDLLNDAQRIGLRYLRELEAKIPRGEMQQLEALIKAAGAAVDPQLQVEICGSYRRGRPQSGDIDVLV